MCFTLGWEPTVTWSLLQNFITVLNKYRNVLKTPGLNMSSPCLLPQHHGHIKGEKCGFPALVCFMTLGYIFPSVSLFVVFVLTAGSFLGQGQCLITGRTLSKASPGIVMRKISQEVGWATEVQCKSMSLGVPTTPRVVVWWGLGITLLVPIDL